MTTPALYRTAVEGFSRRVDAVDDEQLDDPVPCCLDWDVRGLVTHVTEEALWTPPLLAGEPPERTQARLEDEMSRDDPRAVWTRAAPRAIQAVEEPDALDGTVQTSAGKTDAREFLAEVFADTLIHTWDLANATGSDDRLDPDAVEACAEWFATREDEWRRRGSIGEPADVPPDADAQTRLLARFGRGG